MTGTVRLSRPKFAMLSAASAAALTLALPAVAGQRNPAPIVYAGQGGGQTAPPRQTTRTTRQTQTAPRYTAPRQNVAGQPTGKRIEFRYPDQPNVYHGSDGKTRTRDDNAPIKFSSQRAAVSQQKARQYAAVSAPRRIAPSAPRNPVLHQPDYSRPAIEEVAMTEAVAAPSIRPAEKSTANGVIYAPVAQPGYDAVGVASWYGEEYHGQPTANGETFDMFALSAAHPTLPLPSLAQITNLENGREIVVRVNDRGPFVPDRMIDLSKQAADELGFLVAGGAEVRVRYLGPAPVNTAAAGTGQGGTPPVSAVPNFAAPVYQAPAPQPLHPMPAMDPIPNPISDRYYIQAGSFSDIANAERLSRDLSGSLPVDVVMAEVGGADFFRVVIGPYDSRSDAAAMRDQLDANGIVDGLLVRNP